MNTDNRLPKDFFCQIHTHPDGTPIDCIRPKSEEHKEYDNHLKKCIAKAVYREFHKYKYAKKVKDFIDAYRL